MLCALFYILFFTLVGSSDCQYDTPSLVSNSVKIKMVSWSALGRSFGINLLKNNIKSPYTVQNVNFSVSKALQAGHGHQTMALQPSR